MAAKYHVNAKGEIGVCKARKNCPFGDLEKDHYPTPEAARDAYEGYAKAYFEEKSMTKGKPEKWVQEELFNEAELDPDQGQLF